MNSANVLLTSQHPMGPNVNKTIRKNELGINKQCFFNLGNKVLKEDYSKNMHICLILQANCQHPN